MSLRLQGGVTARIEDAAACEAFKASKQSSIRLVPALLEDFTPALKCAIRPPSWW